MLMTMLRENEHEHELVAEDENGQGCCCASCGAWYSQHLPYA